MHLPRLRWRGCDWRSRVGRCGSPGRSWRVPPERDYMDRCAVGAHTALSFPVSLPYVAPGGPTVPLLEREVQRQASQEAWHRAHSSQSLHYAALKGYATLDFSYVRCSSIGQISLAGRCQV